jgi:acetoacetate decarboxylase
MARKRSTRQAPRSYSMPALSGLYGRPPFEYREAKQMTVEFQTDPRVLRKLVPAPLTPNKDAKVFVSSAEFLSSGFGRYLEAHIFTHATFKRPLVNFRLYLELDSQKFCRASDRPQTSAFRLSNSMFRIVISSTMASSRL